MNVPLLRESRDGLLLAVKVQPRAAQNRLQGVQGSELRIAVTAPPVDSAANEALISFVAGLLGCGRGSLSLARGQASRHKTLLIRGISAETVRERLQLP